MSTWLTRAIPTGLLYHAEHDWARIDGEQADLRDHLVRAGRSSGEVVFFDPPEVGAQVEGRGPRTRRWSP